MSAVLNAFKVGGLITASLCTQREEDVREHGDFLITSVHSDLCNFSRRSLIHELPRRQLFSAARE
jgi:hypothetical protein